MVNTMYAPRTFGGAERIVQVLAETLVARGDDVTVVATAPSDEAQSTTLNGVRVREIGLVNLYWPYGPEGAPKLLEPGWHALDLWNPWMLSRMREVLREEDPDILHTHGLVGFSPHVWRVGRGLGLPIVHTLQDHRLLCVRAVMFKAGRACASRCTGCRVASLIKRPPARAVDVVVGLTQAVLASHIEAGFFSEARTAVIPPPVEMPSTVPRGVKVEGAPIRFGYLGRLQEGKGVELLLEACARLPGGGWELQVAGRGEAAFEERLHRRAIPSAVRFIGHVSATAFLREVDVLVVPSQLREGAGLVVLEAYAHGVPVVATDRGGLPEMVGRDGSCGLLVAPDSVESLVTAMSSLLDRPSRTQEMGEACQMRAGDHSPDRIAMGYTKQYARAIESNRSRD